MIAADQIVANVSVAKPVAYFMGRLSGPAVAPTWFGWIPHWAKLSCTYHFCVLLGNTVCQISLQVFLESYQRYFLK